MKQLFVSEIQEHQPVDTIFMCAAKNQGVTKNGAGYLILKLLDRSGEIEGRVWDRAEELARKFEKSDYVRVRGQATVYQGRLQIRVHDVLKIEEAEVTAGDFLPKSPYDPEIMAAELMALLRGVKNPYLLALGEAFFADEEFMDLFKRAPAGKSIHHCYLSGLLEHTLSLTKLVLKVVENYRDVDVDLLLIGAFLHDMGKIYEFSFDRSVEYTDKGQLLGHLVMEVEKVSEKIRAIPDFPENLAVLVKHMLVSHHGQYEFGSPKLPQTVEALILHYLDDLDGKIQSVQTLMAKEQSRWTSFHRAYGRSFFRGDGPKENGD
ncbi:MAG TPA: HD domain-containing protein [Verrucomicrobiae bacterium]|jgi:3'-5' exoribonuclease|nr:HD domain-containing protein [Verrucomicrobiae bacterium]